MIRCSRCGQLVEENKERCPYCDNDLSYAKDIDKRKDKLNEGLTNYSEVELLTGKKINKADLEKDELIVGEFQSEKTVYERPEKVVIENPFINSTKVYKAHMDNQKDISLDIKKEASSDVAEYLEAKIEAEVESKETQIDVKTVPLAEDTVDDLEEELLKEKSNTKKVQEKQSKRKKPKYDKTVIKNVRSTIKEKPVKVTTGKAPKGAAISKRAVEAFRMSPAIKRRLTKKERQQIFYTTVGAFALLVIAIIYLTYYTVYGDFKSPITNYYKGLNIASEKQILDAYPKCIRANLEFQTLINQLVLPMKSYPEAQFRYEVIKKTKLSNSEVEKQQIDYDLTCGKGVMLITAAYKVDISHIQRPNIRLSEIKEEIQIIVGKIDGKWYILE